MPQTPDRFPGGRYETSIGVNQTPPARTGRVGITGDEILSGDAALIITGTFGDVSNSAVTVFGMDRSAGMTTPYAGIACVVATVAGHAGDVADTAAVTYMASEPVRAGSSAAIAYALESTDGTTIYDAALLGINNPLNLVTINTVTGSGKGVSLATAGGIDGAGGALYFSTGAGNITTPNTGQSGGSLVCMLGDSSASGTGTAAGAGITFICGDAAGSPTVAGGGLWVTVGAGSGGGSHGRVTFSDPTNAQSVSASFSGGAGGFTNWTALDSDLYLGANLGALSDVRGPDCLLIAGNAVVGVGASMALRGGAIDIRCGSAAADGAGTAVNGSTVDIRGGDAAAGDLVTTAQGGDVHLRVGQGVNGGPLGWVNFDDGTNVIAQFSYEAGLGSIWQINTTGLRLRTSVGTNIWSLTPGSSWLIENLSVVGLNGVPLAVNNTAMAGTEKLRVTGSALIEGDVDVVNSYNGDAWPKQTIQVESHINTGTVDTGSLAGILSTVVSDGTATVDELMAADFMTRSDSSNPSGLLVGAVGFAGGGGGVALVGTIAMCAGVGGYVGYDTEALPTAGTITAGAALAAVSPTGTSAARTIGTLSGLLVQNQGSTGITDALGIDIEAQSGASGINLGLRSQSAVVVGAAGVVGSELLRIVGGSRLEGQVSTTGKVVMASVTPTTMGDIGMDTTTGRIQMYVGGAFRDVAHTGELGTSPWTDAGTWLYPTAGEGVAVGATVMSGAEKFYTYGSAAEAVAVFKHQASSGIPASTNRIGVNFIVEAASVGSSSNWTGVKIKGGSAGASDGNIYALDIEAYVPANTGIGDELSAIRAHVGTVQSSAGDTYGLNLAQPAVVGVGLWPTEVTALIHLKKYGGILTNFIECLDGATTRFVVTDTGEVIVSGAAPVGSEKLRVVGPARVEGLLTLTNNAPTAMGQVGMDTSTGRLQMYVGGAAVAVAHLGDLSGSYPIGTWDCPGAVAVGDLVAFSAAGTVDKASASVGGPRPAVGIVVSKPATTQAVVQYYGEVTLAGPLTSGFTYYLSTTAGVFTDSAPSSTGEMLQRIGFAKSATVLVLTIDRDHVIL